MSTVVILAAGAVATAMLASLYRVLRGPTVWDRLSGLALIGTKTVVLLLAFGTVTGTIDAFVDITLAYTLIAYIGAIALAKYFELKEGHEA